MSEVKGVCEVGDQLLTVADLTFKSFNICPTELPTMYF